MTRVIEDQGWSPACVDVKFVVGDVCYRELVEESKNGVKIEFSVRNNGEIELYSFVVSVESEKQIKSSVTDVLEISNFEPKRISSDFIELDSEIEKIRFSPRIKIDKNIFFCEDRGFSVYDYQIGACVGEEDTTPPLRSNGAPTGNLPAGTTQTTISLTTDESATCRYSTSLGIAYASMTNTFSTTGGTSHSQLITGLVDGGNYNYYVRCNDTLGNYNTDDYAISFRIVSPGVERDNTPRTCSQAWGFDCGELCSFEQDNTYDSCNNCNQTDERINEIYLNATSVLGFEYIRAICEYYTSEKSDSEMYVYYRNSTTSSWQPKCAGSTSGIDLTIRNWTPCDIRVDNVAGEHQVRCIINYEGTDSSCQIGSWFDHDDVNFSVIF